MPDGDIPRVYRLSVNATQHPCLGMSHGAVDKGNNNGRHHLVIGSVRPDAKHVWFSKTPSPADGAGGSGMD